MRLNTRSFGYNLPAATAIEFNKVLNGYVWGESKPEINLLRDSSKDIFTTLRPFILRRDTGILLVCKTTKGELLKNGSTLLDLLSDHEDSDMVQGSNFIITVTSLTSASISTPDTVIEGDLSTITKTVTSDAGILKTNMGALLSDYTKNKLSDSPKEEVTIYLRLYPQTGVAVFPTRQINTEILTNNEILQSSFKKSNLVIQLQNCVALDSADTQWVDIYQAFFDFWIDNRNKKMQVIFGGYTLNNCYLAQTPIIVKNLTDLGTFNLNIVSTISDIKEIENG